MTTTTLSLRDRAVEAYERAIRDAEARQRAERQRNTEIALREFHDWARKLGVTDTAYVSVDDAGNRVTARVDDLTLYYERTYRYDYGYQDIAGVELPCGKCSEPVPVAVWDLEQLGRVLSEPAFHTRCPRDEKDEDDSGAAAPTPELPRMSQAEKALLDALNDFVTERTAGGEI